MSKADELLERLKDSIFSEDDKENKLDNHSDPFFDVSDLGRYSWSKTGWDINNTNKPYPWEPGYTQGNVVEQDEQDDEEKPKEEPVTPEPEAAPEPEENPSAEPSVGEPDMGATGAGMDNMGMGGLGMPEEEPKEPKELGRTYELKKIYTRLVSIESYLSTSSDESLIKLRNYVSKAIELFRLVISNIESYKDKIDDIIVTYYKFLKLVYDLLKNYYKKKEKSGE